MTRQLIHRVGGYKPLADGDIEGCYQGALAVEYGFGFEQPAVCCLVTRFQVFHERQAEILVYRFEFYITVTHADKNAAKLVYRTEAFHAPAPLYFLEPCEPFRQGKAGLRHAFLHEPFVGGRQFLQLTQPVFESGLGFAHGGCILTHGLVVRFRHKVEFQVLVTTVAVVVTIQVNGLIPVLHRLEPDLDRRFLCIFVSVACHYRNFKLSSRCKDSVFSEPRNKNG